MNLGDYMNRQARKALDGRVRYVGCCKCGEYRLPLRKIEGRVYCPIHVPKSGTKKEEKQNAD